MIPDVTNSINGKLLKRLQLEVQALKNNLNVRNEELINSINKLEKCYNNLKIRVYNNEGQILDLKGVKFEV